MIEKFGSKEESPISPKVETYTAPKPPSVEFFNTTEEGMKLKKKIDVVLEDAMKEVGRRKNSDPDLRQFNTSFLTNIAQIKYYLGEDPYPPLRQAFKDISHNTIDTFRWQTLKQILEVYVEGALPDDDITLFAEKYLQKAEEIKTQPVNEIILGDVRFRRHSIALIGTAIDDSFNEGEIEQQLSELYIKRGELNRAITFMTKITDDFKRINTLTEIAKALPVGDATRKDLFAAVEKEVMTDVGDSGIFDAHQAFFTGLSAYEKLRNGEFSEATALMGKIRAGAIDQKIVSLLNMITIIEAEKIPNISIEPFLIQARSFAGQVKVGNLEHNNNYGRIAAIYARLGRWEEVDEMFAKIDPHTFFDRSSFFNSMSPRYFENNPKLKERVYEEFTKQKEKDPKVLKIQSAEVRVLTQLGRFDEAFDAAVDRDIGQKISTSTLALHSLLVLVQTANEALEVSRSKKKIEKPENTINWEKVIQGVSDNKSGFVLGKYFPQLADHLDERIPTRIRFAISLGKSYATGESLNEYNFGALYDPQSVRSFLEMMDQFHFKHAPELLERVFEALPNELDAVVYDYIATHPDSANRFLRLLIATDLNKGSQYTTNVITRKNTPDRVFLYFSKLFIERGRFTVNAKEFLKRKENIPDLRRLLAQHPNEFNTVLDVLAGLGIFELQKEKTLWEALEDLSLITPGIYAKYKTLSGKERKDFIQWIKDFDYSSFFENVPLKLDGRDLKEEDRVIMIDLLYRAYAPIGMSFNDVKELLPKVKNHTADLKEYVVKKEYEVTFRTPSFKLRPNESINTETERKVKELFMSYKDYMRPEAILKLVRATTDFSEDETIAIFSLLNEHSQISEARRAFDTTDEQEKYHNFMNIKELVGIFAKDNLGNALQKGIEKDPVLKERVAKIFSNPDRRKNLLAALGNKEENNLTKDIPTLELAARLFSEKVLSKYTMYVNRELRKFMQFEEATSTINAKKAHAYISKNRGSFFAKATAGVCTSRDIVLWDLPNHFHINIVNEEQLVKGNVMGYIETINNEKGLVLRGFNPTEQYLKEISAESFIEETLHVAREFIKDNNMSHLYLVEGGINHAESNRPAIRTYLNKYFAQAEKVVHKMQVSSAGFAQEIWKIE